MELIKVEDGLIEDENYFLKAPIGDFLGDFLCTRTADTFNLTSGYVERNFPHDEYVIIVEKEPIALDEDDSYKFYTRKGNQMAGLLEEKEEGRPAATHWKLIRHKGFIQGYRSDDGILWVNKGGGEAEELTRLQGFSIKGSKELKIKSYRVYRNPYIRLYNLEQGTKAILYDNVGSKIIERAADEDDLIEIYLENPLIGKIKIYDKDGFFLKETPLMELKYGDTFFSYPYDIEFYYKGILLDYRAKKLNTRHEIVVMKNASTSETYTDLKLTVVHDTVDDIKISLDDTAYYDELIVPTIEPSEQKDIYIKIVKNSNHPSYGIRSFAIEIDEGRS